MADLGAVILNYNSGTFTRGCVRSLRAECEREKIDLETVIVDNASPQIAEDRPVLEALARSGARVIYHDRNPGYGGGMNLGLAHLRAPIIAILNPDLHFFPGSVGRLYRYVRDYPECGAVGPRSYLDDERGVVLPPNPLPTLGDHWRQALAHFSAGRARAYARRRSRLAHRYWAAREPLEVEMLSGCCIFLRREVISKLGGLFDERFPLYYEDADLFRRISRVGLKNVYLPAAEIAHYYSRSAGTAGEESMRRYWISQRHYFFKWYGPLGFLLGYHGGRRALDWWPQRWKKRPPQRASSLGPCSEPPLIHIPTSDPFFLELTMDPMFFLAGGILEPTNPFRFPGASWDCIPDCEYYLRAVDERTFRTIGSWSFERTQAPAVSGAVTAGS